MGVTISVEGLEDVLDALESLTEKELFEAAKPGMRRGLKLIQEDAQANCPVDTGELREKIKTRVRIDKNALTGEVYSGAPHGIYVEMGTGPKGEKKHDGVNPEWGQQVTYRTSGWVYPTEDGGFRFTRGMPARPFLYPAFKANEKKAQEKIADAVVRHVRGG